MSRHVASGKTFILTRIISHRRAKTAEKKYDDLRKLAEDQASALNNAADSEKKVLQKSLDSDHQLQLLQMDKSFLQKELELTAQRAERSEKDNQRNEDLLREAMVKRDELLMQLSEARHEGKSLYEQKLEKEINKLREVNFWGSATAFPVLVRRNKPNTNTHNLAGLGEGDERNP